MPRAAVSGIIALSFAFCAVQRCHADDWPTFRGPNGNGVSSDSAAPAEWNADTNVRWKAGIPGSGWSAPVVTGGKVLVTTAVPAEKAAAEESDLEDATVGRTAWQEAGEAEAEGQPLHRFEIHCFDLATGKRLWNRVAAEGVPRIPKHRENTYATETPVTDRERIIAYFGMTGVFCYDLAGQLLWHKDLGAFPMQADWGTASSLAMHDGLVFVQVDNEQESFLVALDATSGDQRWRVPRDEGTNWCSPVIWKNKVRAELVVGGKTVRSYDPHSGELLWELSVGDRGSSASPAGNEEMLIVGGRGMFAVKAGATGDITPAEAGEAEAPASGGLLWANESGGPSMASPLIYQGFVYVLERRGGIVTCYHAATGEPAYKERLPGSREFWASPWASGGKVFCQDAAGATHVLAPGPEFKLIGTNQLDGRFWATSAVADGALLLRGDDTLFCVGSPINAGTVRAVRAETTEPAVRR